METIKETSTIKVETLVNCELEKCWDYFTKPEHITQWYFASDDWHAPEAENDLKVDGKFRTKMAAKDGSAGFDFEGVYTTVDKYKNIEYKLADDRKVKITFSKEGDQTKVVETFDPENVNSRELQQGGWQSILYNYKKYCESH